jgi:hypothetical protein
MILSPSHRIINEVGVAKRSNVEPIFHVGFFEAGVLRVQVAVTTHVSELSGRIRRSARIMKTRGYTDCRNFRLSVRTSLLYVVVFASSECGNSNMDSILKGHAHPFHAMLMICGSKYRRKNLPSTLFWCLSRAP